MGLHMGEVVAFPKKRRKPAKAGELYEVMPALSIFVFAANPIEASEKVIEELGKRLEGMLYNAEKVLCSKADIEFPKA